MDTKYNIFLKIAAILLILVGLLVMLVAWQLMLGAGVYNSTVVVLEMGGVVVCMVGYFLWRRIRVAEDVANRRIQAIQPTAEEGHQE